MPRVIFVANRLPVTITEWKKDIAFSASPGGLASGIASLSKTYEYLCVGWPGIVSEKLKAKNKDKITKAMTRQKYHPVFLTQRQLKNYYDGFCNKTLWPLFHYFSLYAEYEKNFWESYKEVNQVFCEEVIKLARPGDNIWVHDYQLMLLPQLIREKRPDASIGFFLHIPFPSFELFRMLPWRQEILSGLLGADLIGFHTHDYAAHFLNSASRIFGLEHHLGKINVDSRLVQVDTFPMGINYEKFSKAVESKDVRDEIKKSRQKVGQSKIVLSIDRMDYTKGIIQRLEAFDLFLTRYPKYKGKVTLILVTVPSRTGVEYYQQLRNNLEHLVGKVNGEHGMLEWMPVWYLYRSMPFDRLVALYTIADVALVTPLRDGMNLIAKEFVATNTDGNGVLILSEMAGAASELGEAIIVNPNNRNEMVEAIKKALEMPLEEQIERNKAMQQRLSYYTVTKWAADFLTSLSDIKKAQEQLLVTKLSDTAKKALIDAFKKSKRRLFLLDYDGTLVQYYTKPQKAGPDAEILDLLRALSSNPKNDVIVISGRDKDTLTKWLGGLDIALIAEHGSWIRPRGHDWRCIVSSKTDWKDVIRPVLQTYTDRTPGAMIEEKNFSLVWHYRRSNPELAHIRVQELKDALRNLTSNLDIGVFDGSKILEIRSLRVNKGLAVEPWLKKEKWDFILAAGDDYTDEDMFAALPEKAYSIRVGFRASKAKFNTEAVRDIRQLLKEMLKR